MATYDLTSTSQTAKTKWHKNISPDEFAHPELMSPRLIRALGQTRTALDIPMYFTYAGGRVRHPNGDAVPHDHPSHARYSLHKAGVNHVESYRAGSLIQAPDELGLAVDLDFGPDHQTFGALFDLYVAMEGLNIWGGIGLYPNWHNAGFHLDVRPKQHNAFGARWVGRTLPGITKQVYPRLTWRIIQEHAAR